MIPLSSSSNSSPQDEYLDHVIEELERFELLPVHVIHLYLSSAIPEIQKKIAPTDSDLLKFLTSYPDLFEINNMFEASYSKSNKVKNRNRFTDRNGGILPVKIENGRGLISRLFTAYGFINATHPFETCIYFSSRMFNKSYELAPLDLSEFKVNQVVGFNAEFGSNGNSDTPYRAINVWKVCEEEDDDDEDDHFSCDSRASSKSQNSTRSKSFTKGSKYNNKKSLANEDIIEEKVFYSRNGKKPQAQPSKNDKVEPYAKSKSTHKAVKAPAKLKSEGVINNLFFNFGFITSRGDKSDKVFFTLKVAEDLKDNFDLRHTFKIGDVVKFTAIPSSKKDSSVAWQATSVVHKDHYTEEISGSDKTYNDIDSLPLYNGGLSSTEEDSATSPTPQLPENSNHFENRQGKIYPQSDSSALIKFGLQYRELANAETCNFYMGGSPITDVRWEFHNGDLVYFDAVRNSAESSWEAILVWQGQKPNILESDSESGDEISQKDQHASNFETNFEAALTPDKSAQGKTFLNLTKTTDWGDSPFPDELTVDESSPIDSGSHYSSTESHLSAETGTTPQRNKKLSGDNQKETASGSSFKKLNHKGSESFISKKCHNVKDKFKNDTVKSDKDCKPVNSKINQINASSSNSSNNKCNFKEKKIPDATLNSVLSDEDNTNHKAYNDRKITLPKSTTKQNGVSGLDDSKRIKKDIEIKSIDEEMPIGVKKKNEHSSEIENMPIGLDSVHDDTSVPIKPAGVLIFENLKGKIQKIYRIHVDVECVELNKRIALVWNDLYHDGVLISEKCRDLKELLKPNDKLSLNFFEITDDHGLAFRKITLAWIGEKPKNVKEMEPQEFIEMQDLEVSCEIPSRKNYKAFLKNQADGDSKKLSKIKSDAVSEESGKESLRHLNDSDAKNIDSAMGARKKNFMSTSFTPNDNELNADIGAFSNNDLSKADGEFMTPANISSMLFARVRQIRQTLRDPTKCVQIIDELECNLESAVSILQQHLSSPLKVERTSLVDSGCQTNENTLLPLDSDIRHTSKTQAKSLTNSSYVQTIITGDIIATGVFPH